MLRPGASMGAGLSPHPFVLSEVEGHDTGGTAGASTALSTNGFGDGGY